MADLKISQLTGASTPLAGTEVLPIVQSGSTKKVSVADLTLGRAVASAGGTFSDNFVQSTAAKGVNFTANTGAAGMTSQLLNWYEEGLWNPILVSEAGAFGAITYNALNGGRYTRIGRVVHIQALLYTDSVTVGTANSDVRIGGLPFTAVANSGPQDGISSLAVSQSLAWVTNQPTGALVRAGTTQVDLIYRTTANGAPSNMTVPEVTTGSTGNLIRIAGTYICA